MKKTALLIVVAAASMHGMTAAVPTPPVKIAGTIGERFDLTVRGNFMKLDLEKDFFRPFKDRSSSGGFIGLGKLADAAVHLAWNSGEADVVARKVDAFKDWAPYDVQTEMSMDPNQLAYEDGKVFAVISTQHWSVGIANFSVDGHNPDNVRRVALTPFADEDNTLTYFRAPNIEDESIGDDELFGK